MRDDVLDALFVGAVIPLTTERKPCVPFAEAARNPDDAQRLFDRFPNAGIGVLTEGHYVVLDVESVDKHGRDGFATIDTLEHRFGRIDTRSHRTKSGGLHLVCVQPPGAKIRSAQEYLRGADLAAPGLDIVAGNQVMRWIGTTGYELQADREIEMLPASWVAALSDPPEPERRKPDPKDTSAPGRRYAVVALERATQELAATGAQRNVTLTAISYRLGRMCPPLAPDEVEGDLLLACEANGSLREHGRRACVGTIRRGMMAGHRNPLRLVGA